MSIGLGIFLLAVGAILTFAVNVSVDVINLDLIGYILMGAGLIVIKASKLLPVGFIFVGLLGRWFMAGHIRDFAGGVVELV